ncbi:MAG: hypothetical protein UY62_C0001G0021 [Parcubacteria group bacterium GW2011_GWF2_50_9]|nr:MAG: hypothetical protein UY62_C0001G0021 [Parcubacteria group bacterium GW2011_GWF2_50_9]
MKQSWLKLAGMFAFGLLFRLLPFRPPNVELIMASQMPVAKTYGKLAGFFFGAFSILAFDVLTGTPGPWSLVTAPTYGLLGVFAAWYLKNRHGKRHFAYFALFGTLLYDAITGLTVGPLFFHQPFLAAVLGQIPFTFMHLLGNIGFAIILSPMIERWLAPQIVLVYSKHQIPGAKFQTISNVKSPKFSNEDSAFVI